MIIYNFYSMSTYWVLMVNYKKTRNKSHGTGHKKWGVFSSGWHHFPFYDKIWQELQKLENVKLMVSQMQVNIQNAFGFPCYEQTIENWSQIFQDLFNEKSKKSFKKAKEYILNE